MKYGTYKPRFYPHKGTNPFGEPVDKYPSVTTILSILDKFALRKWAANCAVDWINKFTDVHGKIECTEVLVDARTAYIQESMEAAEYGTYIHTLCVYYFKTGIKIKTPHKQTQKLMVSFYAWVKKHTVKPIATEVVVYGDGYAGRVDLVCEIDQFWYKSKDKKDQTTGRKRRVVTLIDFKTGKGSYYPEWGLQTAAYRMGGYYRDLNQPPITYHGVLKFNKETCRVNYKDYAPDYGRDYKSFMDLVRFYWRNMEEI